jgi:type II secretion system protein N
MSTSPVLRSPAPDAAQPASQSKWRSWRATFGYAAFGLVVFAGFLFATFPYTATFSKVLAPMGFEFSSASQSINFPFGAELTQVRVSSTTSAAQYPVIECPLMTIAPSILSLFTLQPGVRVKANLYDGVARATIRPSGGGTAISYSLDAVNIAQQRLFALPADSAASGTMSGHGKLWFSPTDLATDSGDGEMSGAGLAIKSDFLNAPIQLGSALAKFKIDRGFLTIEELKTSGGDVALSASGTIQLAPDPADSVVAIQFTIVPTPDAASRLSLLFALLPRHQGTQPYQLTGTLASPQIS